MRRSPQKQTALILDRTKFRKRNTLPPASVHPHPLFGMVANPVFDHGGHQLHGAGHVYFFFVIARQRQRFSHFELVPAIAQSNHTSAVDRTFKQSRHPSEHAVDAAVASEKTDLDAVSVVLIDQHAHETVTSKGISDFDRRIDGLRELSRPHRNLEFSRSRGQAEQFLARGRQV